MREINREEGRVYSIGEFYYLEKIYKDLAHLIKDEVRIKKRARDNKFTVLSSSWGIKENLFYNLLILADILLTCCYLSHNNFSYILFY